MHPPLTEHRCPNSLAGFFFQSALSAPRSEETHGSPNAPLSVCSARIGGKIKEATRGSKRIIVSGLHQQESLRNKQVGFSLQLFLLRIEPDTHWIKVYTHIELSQQCWCNTYSIHLFSLYVNNVGINSTLRIKFHSVIWYTLYEESKFSQVVKWNRFQLVYN